MNDRSDLIHSPALSAPHGFLTGPQSDRHELDRVAGEGPTVWVNQVHSSRVVTVSEPFFEETRPDVDAMVTGTASLRLAIVTADCAPVLLEDKQAGVIGAAHAGWRGAHGGVLENTVAAMVALGATPANITAAIGPCIAQANYEVDEDFRRQFTCDDARFFEPGREGHHQFDLEGYAASRLGQAGVGVIDRLSIDTYANEVDFYSYRRATHRDIPTDGRQVSLIALG